MNEWYSHPLAARLKKRARRCKWLIFGVTAAALAGCILMCTQVRTGNASRLLGCTIALSTLGGWAAMALIAWVYRPAKAQAGHMESLLDCPEETHTGRLSLSEDGFQIPGSIVVRKARLQTGEETLSFNLNARYARELPPAGTPVRVTTVRTFITAVEVCRDEEA